MLAFKWKEKQAKGKEVYGSDKGLVLFKNEANPKENIFSFSFTFFILFLILQSRYNFLRDCTYKKIENTRCQTSAATSG